MMQKAMKLPGADHPITIERYPAHVTVSVSGKAVADTKDALMLREAAYPGVLYIPRNDANMALLERTDHSTYCPYKGDCSYYSIAGGGEKLANAIWTYEQPYGAVAEIKDHLAFYADRFEIVETPATA